MLIVEIGCVAFDGLSERQATDLGNWPSDRSTEFVEVTKGDQSDIKEIRFDLSWTLEKLLNSEYAKSAQIIVCAHNKEAIDALDEVRDRTTSYYHQEIKFEAVED